MSPQKPEQQSRTAPRPEIQQYFAEAKPVAKAIGKPTPSGMATSLSTAQTHRIVPASDQEYAKAILTELAEVKMLMQKQGAPHITPFCTFISTLAVSDLSVVKPIPVTVEPEEDGSFVASFIDAGICSGGDTIRDAIWSLQQMIATSFNTLCGMADSKLGPKMLRKRDVLMEFLCRSPKTTP